MKRPLLVVGVVGAGWLVTMFGLPALMMTTLLSRTSHATPGAAAGGVTSCSVDPSQASIANLDAEQVSNARLLIAVGKSLHVPPRGWVIAIATALQESGLRNLDYGDRDSLGLMQQRPSASWGTAEQVQNPTYAARAFYGGPQSPTGNTGLLGVPGWRDMPLWQAAQTVQGSAFPLAYAQHEALATELVHRLAGHTAGCRPLASGRWQLPVDTAYALTSGYGRRISPTYGTKDFHTGQDFAVPTGTSARAVSSGVVDFTGWAGGYGNLIRVRHANGVESWYGHLSRIDVHIGEHVRAGGRLGETGSTGNSTGPHLHLEIRLNDEPTDPLTWLRKKGLTP